MRSRLRGQAQRVERNSFGLHPTGHRLLKTLNTTGVAASERQSAAHAPGPDAHVVGQHALVEHVELHPVPQRALLAALHVVAGVASKSLCTIAGVISNSVAAAAGVQPGDALRSVNSVPVVSPGQFVDYMTLSGTNAVSLVLVRQGQPVL